MIDFDRMVLLSGLVLVVAVATFNNVQASAPQPGREPTLAAATTGILFNRAVEPMAEPKPIFPVGYWTVVCSPETRPA